MSHPHLAQRIGRTRHLLRTIAGFQTSRWWNCTPSLSLSKRHNRKLASVWLFRRLWTLINLTVSAVNVEALSIHFDYVSWKALLSKHGEVRKNLWGAMAEFGFGFRLYGYQQRSILTFVAVQIQDCTTKRFIISPANVLRLSYSPVCSTAYLNSDWQNRSIIWRQFNILSLQVHHALCPQRRRMRASFRLLRNRRSSRWRWL